LRDVGASDAAVVEGDRLVALGEPRKAAVPAVGVRAEAHDQQHGLARAVRLVVEADSVRRGRVRHPALVACADASRKRRRHDRVRHAHSPGSAPRASCVRGRSSCSADRGGQQMTRSAQRLFDLTGKVALITGGSRGLGREMALAFAQAGAGVVIASRKADACERVAAEVEALGRKALPHACHVGDWQALDALADAAWSHFGKVDILVNNAGMSPLYPSLAEVSEALWDKVLAVNLKGPFRLTANLGTRMAAAGGGSIINVSSIAAIRPTPTETPYAAAKAGLNALTVAFAH